MSGRLLVLKYQLTVSVKIHLSNHAYTSASWRGGDFPSTQDVCVGYMQYFNGTNNALSHGHITDPLTTPLKVQDLYEPLQAEYHFKYL